MFFSGSHWDIRILSGGGQIQDQTCRFCKHVCTIEKPATIPYFSNQTPPGILGEYSEDLRRSSHSKWLTTGVITCSNPSIDGIFHLEDFLIPSNTPWLQNLFGSATGSPSWDAGPCFWGPYSIQRGKGFPIQKKTTMNPMNYRLPLNLQSHEIRI